MESSQTAAFSKLFGLEKRSRSEKDDAGPFREVGTNGTKNEPSGILRVRFVSRACFSSMLSALMTLTLLWGGCISCDQFFMFPQSKTDCCKKDVCEKPSKHAPAKTNPTNCEKMALDLHGNGNARSDATAKLILPAVELPALDGLILPVTPCGHPPAFRPITGSPPDLSILNSSFLI